MAGAPAGRLALIDRLRTLREMVNSYEPQVSMVDSDNGQCLAVTRGKWRFAC
jgi:hypothetical protein